MRRLSWALLVVTGLLGWCLWLTNLTSAASIASPARWSVPTTHSLQAGPGSSTVSLAVPSFCLSATAIHRTYPLSIPAGDQYARSGEHGHGKLTCIVFMTRTYSKVLVIDQAAGGYKIGPLGVDVTYVDCGLPGYRFPPNNIDNGPNDCADVGAPSESNWIFPPGSFAPGTPMVPGSTP